MTLGELAVAGCTQCGLCVSSCPTAQSDTHERSNPRGRVQTIKLGLAPEVMSGPALEPFWACLSCGACTDACPTGVDVGGMVAEERAKLPSVTPRDFDALRALAQSGNDADAALLHTIDTVASHVEDYAVRTLASHGQVLLVGSALTDDERLAAGSALLSRFGVVHGVHRSWATGILKDGGQHRAHALALQSLIDSLGASRLAIIVALDREAMRLSATVGPKYEVVPLPAVLARSGMRTSLPTCAWLWDGTTEDDAWVVSLQQILETDVARLPARFGPAAQPPILQHAPAKAHMAINRTKREWLGDRQLVTADVLSQIRFPRARFYLDLLTEQYRDLKVPNGNAERD